MWIERERRCRNKKRKREKEEKGKEKREEREEWETIKVQLSRFDALYKERTVARDAGVDDAGGSILVEAAVHVYLERLCACREGVCQFSIPEATNRTITSRHVTALHCIATQSRAGTRQQ